MEFCCSLLRLFYCHCCCFVVADAVAAVVIGGVGGGVDGGNGCGLCAFLLGMVFLIRPS